MTNMKFITLLLFTVLISFNSFADELSDADDAYKREDFPTAFKLYHKLADQGDVSGMFYVGYMFKKGMGVLQDYKQSVYWYNKAAERGLANAQTSLGFMYYSGEGVPESLVKAHMFMNIASVNEASSEYPYLGLIHSQEATRTKRDEIEKLMTSAQVTEAQKLASEWMKAHPY